MLKKTFAIFFSFFPVLVGAQSNADKLNIPINLPDSSLVMNTINKINPENITYGFQIIPTIGWMDIKHDDLLADGASLNFRIGGVIEYKLLSFLKIASGINYNNMAGYVYDNAVLNNNSLKNNFRINYSMLEIPLSAKISTPIIDKTSYFLLGGLSGCFVVNATEKYFYTDSNTKPLVKGILPLTNASFVCYNFGAGFSYKILKNTDFVAKLVYKKALTNIASGSAYTNTGRYSTDPLIYPASLELSFGLLFSQK